MNPNTVPNSKNHSELYSVMEKCDKIITKMENFIASVCFGLMWIFVVVGIVLRFVLRIPNPFGEEAARYLMIFGVYVGISIGVRQRRHLGIQFFVEQLPTKISKIVKFVASLMCISAFLVFSYLALLFVISTHRFGQTSPSMLMPMYIIYLTLLLGFFLSFIRSIMIFWNDFFAKSKILD